MDKSFFALCDWYTQLLAFFIGNDFMYVMTGGWGCLTFGQISPLRFATVEMTIDRVASYVDVFLIYWI